MIELSSHSPRKGEDLLGIGEHIGRARASRDIRGLESKKASVMADHLGDIMGAATSHLSQIFNAYFYLFDACFFIAYSAYLHV